MNRTHPRREGRPSVDDDDTSVYVGVTLPGRQYDDYSQRALREGVSVPEVIRRELREKKTKN
jgi:LDH2 family malate/lactate/ureidoglycolate dehydrogenase